MMRYDSLPQIEARFRSEAAAYLRPFSLPVSNEPALILNGLLYSPPNRDYYYSAAHPKERIVLHFTAGNTRSDMISLTQPGRHVSVAFVIARDGTIYQLFPSAGWSGHIGAGIGNQGTGNSQDKATIGIEISNYGYLVPQGNQLETIYSRVRNPATGRVSPPDPYCLLSQTEAYTKLDDPYRGQSYYATYTPEQMNSTIILLRFLTAKYNIPRQFLPQETRYMATNDVLQFKGIVTHANYRPSGKWDIGPAFDWAGLMASVQQPQYTSTAPAPRGIAADALDSEDDITALFATQETAPEPMTQAGDNSGYAPELFENAPLQPEGTAPGKLRALLAGINNYRNVNPLTGCLKDVENMEKYLRKRTSFTPGANDIRILRDDEATRDAIIAGIRELKKDAQPEDTLLFFFSGHGAQEHADPAWQENDGFLETIVCYDATDKDAEFMLTDKELRFLLRELHEATGAHILAIFDCCHAGDNTRGAGIRKAYNNEIHERRLSETGEQREWDDFLFADVFTRARLEAEGPAQLLPEGSHVQMAACEDDQLSIEKNGAGVFTTRLLATLDAANGNLSYLTLRDRLRQTMRFTYEQTPRIYAAGQAHALLQKGFLNQRIDQPYLITEVSYNKSKGWQLNLGAIHGIQTNSTILVTDSANPNKTYSATVDEIGVDYTKVTINSTDPMKPDSKKSHRARVTGIMSGQLRLELNNVNGNPAELEKMLEQLDKEAENFYTFASGGKDGAGEQPDYTLHIRYGDAIISLPGDPYRPVTAPVPLDQEHSLATVIAQLKQLSRWHFIKQLRNTAEQPGFPPQPLDIAITRITTGGARHTVPEQNEHVVLEYEETPNGWIGALEVKLTNTTDQDLYVAAIFLDALFGSTGGLLPGDGVIKLPPGKSEFLINDNKPVLELELEQYVQEYNWPSTREAFTFLVSTEVFSVSSLEMPGLPAPPTTNKTRSRGVKLRKPEERGKPKFTGWATQHLDIQFINPTYNIIDAKTLDLLLKDEETAFFAAGIYYNVKLDANGQPSDLELKPEITVIGAKSILGDLKLKLANLVETTMRKKLYRRLKKTDLPRIVAEGDSWFQYPILVKDILDHLYRHYAICSIAEAGDTLENYMVSKDYLKYVKSENPPVFLVSGGGNDILGSQFRDFLREAPDPGDTTLNKYLEPLFHTKLQQLQDWYRVMFNDLIAYNANIRILAHSYDYVIPVDTDIYPKKTSWLGKYMIEKNIREQDERERLLIHILDQFNDKLKAVIEEFPQNATYIDARKLVNRDSWYDEIHPTNEGFALVADKFIAAMS